MGMIIDSDSRVMRRPDLFTTSINGETVMMNADRGEYCALDPIASDIWERLARPRAVGELARELGEVYEGDPAVILADLLALLNRLAAQDVIRPA